MNEGGYRVDKGFSPIIVLFMLLIVVGAGGFSGGFGGIMK